MKKHSHRLLFFFSLISFYFADAQIPSIQWEKTFGTTNNEQAYCTQQTADGGYIVAGSANYNMTGNHGGYDFWVVKLSSAGISQWQQCYGGGSDDVAYCIQQTTDGGYIVCGSTVSNDGQVTGLHPSPGNPLWGDYWIVKIDSAGMLQWQKTLGGSSSDEAHSITQTTDGGYIVVGVAVGGSADGDFVNGGNIIKLSSTGAIEWHHYQGGNFNYSVNQTTDGGYLVAGTLLDQYSVLKLDSLGAQQWWKFYGGGGHDQANSSMQTTDGGYIIAGYTQSGDGDVSGYHGGFSDVWVIKLDSLGNLLWEKTLGGNYDDEGNSIKQTTDGGYIVAGITNSDDGDVSGFHGVGGASGNSGPSTDYWVVKINSTGTIEWQKSMGGSYIDKANSIALTTDGGYIVAGSVVCQVVNDGDITGFNLETTNPNASGFDYWIVKLAPEITTDVKTNSINNSIAVYPNPASNSICINGLANKTNNIKLLNGLGIVVGSWANTSKKDLDIGNLPDGIYFLVVENSYFKIIKK